MGWILDYPSHLLVKKYRKIRLTSERVNSYPSEICIPPALRKLLTVEQKKFILVKWYEKYAEEVNNFGIEFK